MAAVKRWETSEDWNAWINAASGGEIRVLSGGLLLPTLNSRPPTSGSPTLTRVARWRFAQNQTGNDESTHHATIPAGSAASITEFGMLFNNRNALATVVGDSDLAFPDATNNMVMSCWFRSIITDYSAGFGLIAGYHVETGDGQIAYALVIDDDDRIKAFVRTGGATTKVSPSGGNVTIDGQWHHMALFLGTTGTGQLQLVVDANGTWAPATTATQTVSGNAQFSIGSSEFSSERGVAGYIDELQVSEYSSLDGNNFLFTNKRFETTVFQSTVFDSKRNGDVLSSIFAEFDTSNDSSVTFSFRADDEAFDQDDTTVAWTGFTSPNQVTNGVIENLSNLGIFAKGRFQQVRAKLVPSTSNSTISDALQSETPKLNTVEINVAPSPVLINTANAAFEPGTVLGQVITFKDSKEIHKVSLNLSVTADDRKSFFTGKGGTVSFQASNFQSSRDEWAFQPVLHWTSANGWSTSGTTIQNTLQAENYGVSDDAALNAPCLTYKLFFNEVGVYDLWGFGFVDGEGIFWSLDSDITNLRNFTLGLDQSGWTGVPRWTKFGSIFIDGGTTHTFTVYLKNINTTILDQWLFTTNKNLSSDLNFEDGYATPLPLSQGPFNTAVRLRDLAGGERDSLENPNSGGASVTSWLSSEVITASSKFNYQIQDNINTTGIAFNGGLSLEYWQIGGGPRNFAAWDFVFPKESIGDSFKSMDFGQSYE